MTQRCNAPMPAGIGEEGIAGRRPMAPVDPSMSEGPQ